MSQDLINRAKHFPKQKSLGQCFLVDAEKLDAAVEVSNLNPEEDIVIEIGPGIGFLTERLVKQVKHLYAVELDASTLPSLKLIKANNKNFDFLRDDILALSVEDILGLNSFGQKIKELNNDEHYDDELIDDQRKAIGLSYLDEIKSGKCPKIKIVANIPYQISSRIILHFLGEIGEASQNTQYISEINILVQKEFAERLMAKPGTKSFGAITLLVNYWAEVEHCFEVPKESFRPSPKVDSTFIKIKLRDKPLVDVKNPKQIRRFIKAIYANRRKKLVNGLKAAGYLEPELEKLALEDNLRGETLNLQEINQLVNKLL